MIKNMQYDELVQVIKQKFKRDPFMGENTQKMNQNRMILYNY